MKSLTKGLAMIQELFFAQVIFYSHPLTYPGVCNSAAQGPDNVGRQDYRFGITGAETL